MIYDIVAIAIYLYAGKIYGQICATHHRQRIPKSTSSYLANVVQHISTSKHHCDGGVPFEGPLCGGASQLITRDTCHSSERPKVSHNLKHSNTMLATLHHKAVASHRTELFLCLSVRPHYHGESERRA